MNSFDNERYLSAQQKYILERAASAENRLYLEFGGKLIGDFHAARVLPGYDPNVKLRLIEKLREDADVIVCIHAKDIEGGKRRADLGITYDRDAMRLIDDLRNRNVNVCAVCITRFSGEPAALAFQERLERYGIPVYRHNSIPGYPADIDRVVSENGFGTNPYIPVSRQLVVVTGPGPNSGKMGTCLSQMYHESRLGLHSDYSKFETFPVWNLPLDHPINIAYEAATADLHDMNAIDFFHVEAYGFPSVNYNRDLQAFPLLRAVLEKISGGTVKYKSPTDMGVNCIATGITDDEGCRAAARAEIARRCTKAMTEYSLYHTDESTLERTKEICAKAMVNPEERDVVVASRKAAEENKEQGKGNKGIFCGAAIHLKDGAIITGKNSPLMHSASSMLINALKHLSGIPKSLHLLLPEILEAIANCKDSLGGDRNPGLNLSETLIALVVSANSNPCAKQALASLCQLQQCDVHLTHVPSPGDQDGLRRLCCPFTYDPVQPTKNLFV